MSTAATTYSTQIGQWDQPQIISFDSLFGKYSIEDNFTKDEVAKINSVVNKWKPFIQEFISKDEGRHRPVLFDSLSKVNDPPLEITTTRRTAHIVHPYTPDTIYKTHYKNSGLNPLATTLRAPMASIMNDVIINEDLSALGIPKKGLIAMCDKQTISQLNENTINDAFIVCAEKINAFKTSETLNILREMSVSSQQNLANQCCTLLLKTGASDFTWPNLQMHRENGKLYNLDTEPLDGELIIDKLGEGFETCRDYAEVSLNERAKSGLELFKNSSRVNKLEIFENVAQSFLEKID